MNSGTQVNQIIVVKVNTALVSTISNQGNGMMELAPENYVLFVKLYLKGKQLLQSFFSRGHATLHLAVSVGT